MLLIWLSMPARIIIFTSSEAQKQICHSAKKIINKLYNVTRFFCMFESLPSQMLQTVGCFTGMICDILNIISQ